MPVLQRITMVAFGLLVTWFGISSFAWFLTSGMNWAVRMNNSGAAGLIIVCGALSGLVFISGLILAGYGAFGDGDKPKGSGLSPEETQAFEDGYRLGVEEAARKAEELLVYADTTSTADKVIPAAIRALNPEPDLEES